VRNATQAVQAGNLSGLEATLTAQAVALDAIFNEMARRAALNLPNANTARTFAKGGIGELDLTESLGVGWKRDPTRQTIARAIDLPHAR
jgi:hypothetical protein